MTGSRTQPLLVKSKCHCNFAKGAAELLVLLALTFQQTLVEATSHNSIGTIACPSCTVQYSVPGQLAACACGRKKSRVGRTH